MTKIQAKPYGPNVDLRSISTGLTEILPYLGVSLLLWIAWRGVAKRRRAEIQARQMVRKSIETKLNEPMTLHPEINPALCAGCGACVKSCPQGEILQLVNHKAVLVSPTKCVGHGECEAACPFDAISLVFGTKTRGMELPRITTNYETNVPGLYIAGELGGMGLIRNAVKQGRLAVQHAAKNLSRSSGPAEVDILIVGAGPAGLSASLEAHVQRRSYICLE